MSGNNVFDSGQYADPRRIDVMQGGSKTFLAFDSFKDYHVFLAFDSFKDYHVPL